MIRMYKTADGNYFMQLTDLTKDEFSKAVLCVSYYHLKYVDKFGYTHKNPLVLYDCFKSLNDEFDCFIPNDLEEAIKNYNPYFSTFKKVRISLDENLFKRWPPMGQYQIDDIKKMVQTGRVLNANKQGTGKTYESVMTINNLFLKGYADKVFIVVIPTMMFSWKRALLEEFSDLFTEKDILIVTEKNRAVFSDCSVLPKVTITSYNTLRIASEYVWKINNPFKVLNPNTKLCKDYVNKYKIQDIEELSKRVYKDKCSNFKRATIDFSTWSNNIIFIADEAHRLVNKDTRWTQIVLQQQPYFKYIFLLTGTPHPKGIQDLYCPLKILDTNLVDSDYESFLYTLGKVGTDYSKSSLGSIDPEKAEKLQRRIMPYVIRHTLRDVADLPPVNFKKIYMELSDKQLMIYRAITESEILKLKDKKGLIAYKDLCTKFPFLLETLSDPCLLKNRVLLPEIETWNFEDAVKFKYTKDIIEDELSYDKDQKIIIWEEHPDTIDRLGKAFEKYKPVIIHGSSHPKNEEKFAWRDKQINEIFKKDKTRRILIANPATIGTGSNLQFCKTIIYYSRSFNFVDYDQSFSRTERLKMIEGVTYYLLLVDKSLDIHCDKVLTNRKILDDLFLKEGLTQIDCKNIFAGVA